VHAVRALPRPAPVLTRPPAPPRTTLTQEPEEEAAPSHDVPKTAEAVALSDTIVPTKPAPSSAWALILHPTAALPAAATPKNTIAPLLWKDITLLEIIPAAMADEDAIVPEVGGWVAAAPARCLARPPRPCAALAPQASLC